MALGGPHFAVILSFRGVGQQRRSAPVGSRSETVNRVLASLSQSKILLCFLRARDRYLKGRDIVVWPGEAKPSRARPAKPGASVHCVFSLSFPAAAIRNGPRARRELFPKMFRWFATLRDFLHSFVHSQGLEHCEPITFCGF